MKRAAVWAAGCAALVLAGLLGAPRAALAHGAEHHGAALEQQEKPRLLPHDRISAVSAPCPGGHPLGVCTCGGEAACHETKSGAFIAVGSAASTMVVAAAAGQPQRPLARAPPRAFSLHYSRAPPALS
jgi:hypothetical protein